MLIPISRQQQFSLVAASFVGASAYKGFCAASLIPAEFTGAGGTISASSLFGATVLMLGTEPDTPLLELHVDALVPKGFWTRMQINRPGIGASTIHSADCGYSTYSGRTRWTWPTPFQLVSGTTYPIVVS